MRRRNRRVLALAVAVGVVLAGGVGPVSGSGPPHDRFEDARLVGALPYSDSVSTVGAGVEFGEMRPCGGMGATVWYRFTPVEDVWLLADTFGSGFDTVLAVYEGGWGEPVACNDDARGTVQSEVEVELSGGVTYYLQVGGWEGEAGDLQLRMEGFVPPEHNEFENARVVGGLPYSDSTHTVGASLEPGEPRRAACGWFGASVWYRFRPVEDVWVVADTFGSEVNPVLAVYEGDPPRFVWCNDNARNSGQAEVTFEASAGVTYYLQVGRWRHEPGEVVLNMGAFTPPPHDRWEDAKPIEALPYQDHTNTLGADAPIVEPVACEIGATVWYRFEATEAAQVEVDTAGSEFDTVVVVWLRLPAGRWRPVGCSADGDDGSLQARMEFLALPTVTYYIQVGGLARGGGLRSRDMAGELILTVAAR